MCLPMVLRSHLLY